MFACVDSQVQHLQQSLHGCQSQVNILTAELQHKCQQLDTLSESHKALLNRFQELTVLMSEAHNKLNTAVAKSGKAIAAGHTKVKPTRWILSSSEPFHELFSHLCHCMLLLPVQTQQALQPQPYICMLLGTHSRQCNSMHHFVQLHPSLFSSMFQHQAASSAQRKPTQLRLLQPDLLHSAPCLSISHGCLQVFWNNSLVCMPQSAANMVAMYIASGACMCRYGHTCPSQTVFVLLNTLARTGTPMVYPGPPITHAYRCRIFFPFTGRVPTV